MTFADEAFAKHCLAHIGYYRLTSYWLPYEADHGTHTFHAGTSFETVLGHYAFDRELRLLVMDAIERIEISMRTRWAFELANAHGPHAHLLPALFMSKFGQGGRTVWDHQRGIEDLEKEQSRSRETWVKHFQSKYDEPLPPLWATCELMTLGAFSKWYSNTASDRLRKNVARSYGLDMQILTSFLHHIAVARNICAHHSRLWNRSFTFVLKLARHPRDLNSSLNATETRKIYNTLTMLAYLMEQISPDTAWKKKVLESIDRRSIDVMQMGFPANFKTTPVWQGI